MRAALVTGGSGLVGGALIARLREDGTRVLATARSLPAERGLAEPAPSPFTPTSRTSGAGSARPPRRRWSSTSGCPGWDPPLRPVVVASSG
jgi:nucleoside-diphosphate-sugar epimerase